VEFGIKAMKTKPKPKPEQFSPINHGLVDHYYSAAQFLTTLIVAHECAALCVGGGHLE